MQEECPRFDAVVIGGGFYGIAIAEYLATRRRLRRVLLIEASDKLCSRASYSNQARVHNGYHYPRSFTTAYRSRVNLPRFVASWPDAIVRDFVAVYAVARQNSKVTGQQFARFCREIGARLAPAPRDLLALFDPHLVERVFLVDEYAFDASRLVRYAAHSLGSAGVEARLGTRVQAIFRGGNGLRIVSSGIRGDEAIDCSLAFNCTYSGLNQMGGDFPGTATQLKHEIAEMALVELPSELKGLGITVMDGPFFSVMPFPPSGLHSLSHVRYTPHQHWQDEVGLDPTSRLSAYPRHSRAERMLRDAARYLPSLARACHIESLFEVKTVLAKSEGDDGRPILFERHPALPGCYSILGGKIDNIFDVLEKLDAESLEMHLESAKAVA